MTAHDWTFDEIARMTPGQHYEAMMTLGGVTVDHKGRRVKTFRTEAEYNEWQTRRQST